MIRRFLELPVQVFLIALLCLPLGAAEARRTHASVGSSIRVDGEGILDFRFIPPALGGGTALTWTRANANGQWYLPLVFDTVGAKTIVVRGKVASVGGALACRAEAIDQLGNVASTSGIVSFPVSASLGSITLNLPVAPAGSMGLLICTFSGNMQAFLLGADYNS
jgi:hypothetical protein